MIEDDRVASSHSDSDASSMTSHESDDDRDQGDYGNSEANPEDQAEDNYGSELVTDHWRANTMTEHRVPDMAEKRRTPGKSNVDGDSDSFSESRIADALIEECDAANHKLEPCPDKREEGTGGSAEARRKGMSVHSVATEADLTPLAIVAQPQQLLSVNQTDFTIEAQPTRSGRIHQTCDMMEVTACLCGSPVESDSRNTKTAVQCGYKGCETLWVSLSKFSPSSRNCCSILPQFHLECLNFDVAPRNWRCPNHPRPTKRQRC